MAIVLQLMMSYKLFCRSHEGERLLFWIFNQFLYYFHLTLNIISLVLELFKMN